MSYVKIGQICDLDTRGLMYLENNNKSILTNNNPQYPLSVIVEIINWDSQEEEKKNGKASLYIEQIIIPTEVDIRQEVLRQLVSKYPTLVL